MNFDGLTSNSPASLCMVLCIIGSCLAHKFAPDAHFFKTKFGQVVLAGITGVLSAFAAVLQTKGFDVSALMNAAIGVLGSLYATKNHDVSDQQVMAARARIKAALPPIAIFLPLFCLLSLTSCAALKTCELNSLPQSFQSATVCIAAAANEATGVDAQAELASCVAGVAGTQGNCLIQAVLSEFEKGVPAHGQTSPTRLAAISRLQIYLNSHGGKAECKQAPTPLVSEYEPVDDVTVEYALAEIAE